MKTTYYIFSQGKLSKKDHSIFFESRDEDTGEPFSRFLPIENISHIYSFSHLGVNSALFNFLGKKGISLHFFDYYEHYTGSFLPRKEMLSGKTLVEQVLFYHDKVQRVWLAKRFIMGGAKNMYRNLKYYLRRGKDVARSIKQIEELYPRIKEVNNIPELFGIEGNIRIAYYGAFNEILKDFSFDKRIKNPPEGEINTLLSFLNMMCYTLCMDMIHQTQLNTTIGYLHEPSDRRHSLALDIAEVFKPVLVDRVIFTLVNKKVIQQDDFEEELGNWTIKNAAKKKIVKAWDEKLKETQMYDHQYVSYKTIILKECHKIQNHLRKETPYKPFESQW